MKSHRPLFGNELWKATVASVPIPAAGGNRERSFATRAKKWETAICHATVIVQGFEPFAVVSSTAVSASVIQLLHFAATLRRLIEFSFALEDFGCCEHVGAHPVTYDRLQISRKALSVYPVANANVENAAVQAPC